MKKINERDDKAGLLLRAISFAARAHGNQFRKDGVTPYASHPFRVCMILRQIFKVDDEEILAAGVLHDTIEDTTTDFDDIKENFGNNVAGWVSLLSKDKRREDAEREDAYIKQLSSAPDAVKLVKLADSYDNLTDASSLPTQEQRDKTLFRARKYLSVLESKDVRLNYAYQQVKRLIAELTQDLRICVVPSKEKAVFRVTESSDAEKLGTGFETPESYKLFLVNETGQDISHVEVSFSGFDGSGDELLQLNKTQKTFEGAKTGQALLLEELDLGLLDFVLCYDLVVHWADNTHNKMSFYINKAYGLKEETLLFEPALKETAYHIEIEKQDKK